MDWRQRHRSAIRIVAVVLTAAFLFYDIAWAEGGATAWSAGAAGKTRPVPAGPENSELIINVQDAHASLSASTR